MRTRALGFGLLIAIIFCCFNTSLAQEGSPATSVGAKPPSGEQEFMEYCAQCHGRDATGNGPVASGLKRKPANLTSLAKQHRGIFPRRTVRDFIVGTQKMPPSHGTREMPIWGYAFMFQPGAMAGPFVPIATPQEVNARIDRLVDYIRSIQQK